MTSEQATSPKATKQTQAREELARLLAATATAGFYGTASLSLIVQDGHIQQVRISTERVVR